MDSAARTHRTRLSWALLAIAGLGLLLHGAWVAGLGKGAIDVFVEDWVYNVALVLAPVICLLKACQPDEPTQRNTATSSRFSLA